MTNQKKPNDIIPFSLQSAPSLIEKAWPTEKISAETQKERKSGSGQTLTGLGSYWKGRKPLVLARACLLGILLPATDDLERDIQVFEKLMGMSDEYFGRRYFKGPTKFAKLFPEYADKVAIFKDKKWCDNKSGYENRILAAKKLIENINLGKNSNKYLESLQDFVQSNNLSNPVGDVYEFSNLYPEFEFIFSENTYSSWRKDVSKQERESIIAKAFTKLSYSKRLESMRRIEEFSDEELLQGVWEDVNSHFGTSASSIPELVHQLGIMRYGRIPKFADTFCGAGSIPFEASRMGFEVYASDLNPVACMLTWGANKLIGSTPKNYNEMKKGQEKLISEIESEISELAIECDSSGNRGKSYLYCVETICPRTGWMVPLAPTWIVSKSENVLIELVPDEKNKRYDFQLRTGLSNSELEKKDYPTVRKNRMYHPILDEEFGVSIKEIRGDNLDSDGNPQNSLRHWEIGDFMPRKGDIWQERLYSIAWHDSEDIMKGKANPRTFFSIPNEEDLEREEKVKRIISENLCEWQKSGIIPSMQIEPGFNTSQPIRERGWTHWHHLYNPRHLIVNAIISQKSKSNPVSTIMAFNAYNRNSSLCYWHNFKMCLETVFYNQALNTFFNYGARSFYNLSPYLRVPKNKAINVPATIKNSPAHEFNEIVDIFITDPPYADAVQYDEITEYFISWLNVMQPSPFSEWIWDSRRNAAIKGSGQRFKSSMIDAYKVMSNCISDYGLQIVMFTHQDSRTWTDMALIFWGAELQIIQDWYISTETITGLRVGGYVQGTHIIVVRKQLSTKSGFQDEIIHEIRTEVEMQLNEMLGLNNKHKESNSESLFNEADLQMAGYAAALRVLTSYTTIDGYNMKLEALRKREKGEVTFVVSLIDFAVQTANEFLVPTEFQKKFWLELNGAEKFYFRMMDIEKEGIAKLDQFQNFAKAFRVEEYKDLMAKKQPNDARLKTALEFGNSYMEDDVMFGSKSLIRIVLRGIGLTQKGVEIETVLDEMKKYIPDFNRKRESIYAILQYINNKRYQNLEDEARAARIIETAIKSEKI